MHMRQRALVALFAGLVLCQAHAVRADVKPNALISENMVLQRGGAVRVWGTADPGEKVTVTFREKEASTTADQGGRWLVRLDSGEAGGPFPMTIAGKNKLQFQNVLVGEVWVCSGQSNMEWLVGRSNQADKDSAQKAPANPRLRLFTVKKNAPATPVADVVGSWVEARPDTVKDFSAVGYFFGRDLQQALKVPVGLIHTSWGGTAAELWTSRPVLEKLPFEKGLFEGYEKRRADYKKQEENYKAALAKHKEAVAKAKAEGKQPPPAPRPVRAPMAPACLYNGMITPLVNYTIKGAIWYQGESNAGAAYNYRFLLAAMIKNWREAWGLGDFPFLIVQLAPYGQIDKEPAESNWAVLRESQWMTAKQLPHVAQAVITDFGHESDIHPTPKQPVGERLALLARALTYGEKVVYSGPEYEGMKVDGNKVVLRFKHVDGGLEARLLEATDPRKTPSGSVAHAWRVKADGGRDVPLQGFSVAGQDQKFVKAQARIEGDRVVVWSDAVPRPVAARYAWQNHPVGNLFNKAGLPATPFRTDDFPVATQPKEASAVQGAAK